MLCAPAALAARLGIQACEASRGDDAYSGRAKPSWPSSQVWVVKHINRIRFHSPGRARPLSPLWRPLADRHTQSNVIAPSLPPGLKSHRLVIHSSGSWAGDECRVPFPAAKFPDVLCIARVPKAVVQNQRGIALSGPIRTGHDTMVLDRSHNCLSKACRGTRREARRQGGQATLPQIPWSRKLRWRHQLLLPNLRPGST